MKSLKQLFNKKVHTDASINPVASLELIGDPEILITELKQNPLIRSITVTGQSIKQPTISELATTIFETSHLCTIIIESGKVAESLGEAMNKLVLDKKPLPKNLTEFLSVGLLKDLPKKVKNDLGEMLIKITFTGNQNIQEKLVHWYWNGIPFDYNHWDEVYFDDVIRRPYKEYSEEYRKNTDDPTRIVLNLHVTPSGTSDGYWRMNSFISSKIIVICEGGPYNIFEDETTEILNEIKEQLGPDYGQIPIILVYDTKLNNSRGVWDSFVADANNKEALEIQPEETLRKVQNFAKLHNLPLITSYNSTSKYARVEAEDVIRYALKIYYQSYPLEFFLYNEINEELDGNRKQRNFLHTAVKFNKLDEVKSYIGRGYSLVSTTGLEGNTLLHWAAKFNHASMVLYLIDCMKQLNIPLSIVNKHGKTAADLATDPSIKLLCATGNISTEIQALLTLQKGQEKELAETQLQLQQLQKKLNALQAPPMPENDNNNATSKPAVAIPVKPIPDMIRIAKGHTIIGNRFALINVMRLQEAERFFQQTGIRLDFPANQNKIKPELGKGAFGRLRIALDMTNKHYVGVKKIKGDEKIAASLNEAKLQQQLTECPHIMPLLNATPSEDNQGRPALYQFMPLAGFGNGNIFIHHVKLIKDNALQIRYILHIAKGLITGLDYMHRKGICHLDIKPDNFVLSIQGHVYLIDFGCAQQFSPTEAFLVTGGDYGDLRYYAPERLAYLRHYRLQQNDAITPATEAVSSYQADKADVWALGVTLCELYFQRYPFNWTNAKDCLNYWDSAYFTQQLNQLFEVSSDEANSLLSLISKLLTVDPLQRPSMAELLKDPLFKTEINPFPFASLDEQQNAFATLKALKPESQNLASISKTEYVPKDLDNHYPNLYGRNYTYEQNQAKESKFATSFRNSIKQQTTYYQRRVTIGQRFFPTANNEALVTDNYPDNNNATLSANQPK